MSRADRAKSERVIVNLPTQKMASTTMTWLQYYQAVKRGDLDTVKKATDKDFRITLTMDKCALELAALYRHQNMVEYFLENADLKEDSKLIELSLISSLQAGDLEITKILMEALGPISNRWNSYVDSKVVKAAIDGKKLECLRLVWQHAKDQNTSTYVKHAFLTGCYDMLNFIREFSIHFGPRNPNNDKLEFLEGQTFDRDDFEIPLCYIYIALGEYELAVKCREIEESAQKNEGERKADLMMEVAGFFGQLEILKKLIDAYREKDVNPEIDSSSSDMELFRKLQLVIKFALRNNHAPIIEFLLKEDWDGWRLVLPPYAYEGFTINEAFETLREGTKHVVVEEISEEVFKKNWESHFPVLRPPRPAPKSTGTRSAPKKSTGTAGKVSFLDTLEENRNFTGVVKTEEYYEYLIDSYQDKHVKNFNAALSFSFVKSLYEHNVDAALFFKKHLETGGMNSCTGWILSDPPFDTVMTSPVLAEVMLSACQEVDEAPLDHFLTVCRSWNKDDVSIEEPIRFKSDYSVELYVKRAGAVLQVFLNHGIPKPDAQVVVDMILGLFDCCDRPAITAAKLISVVRCYNLRRSKICVERIPPKFFVLDWPHRDEILTKLFVALSRTSLKPRININYSLIYLLHSEERRSHFLKCFNKIGLQVDDSKFKGVRQFYENRLAFRSGVFSLQEFARRRLNRYLLVVAHKSRKYVSVEGMIDKLAETMPPAVGDYMKYSDVYDTMSYKFPGRCRELDNIFQHLLFNPWDA